MNSKHLLLTFLLTATPLLAASSPHKPQSVSVTFTVNSATDGVDANPGDGLCADASGQCSLRAAIMEANAVAGPVIITFDSSLDGQPIMLQIHGTGEDAAATGDLDITKALTITGNGSDKTIIDGGGIDRVFDINPGVLTAFAVQIDGVTIQNGSDTTAGLGGGVRVQAATLALNNDLIQNNQTTMSGSAANGGGIYGADATVTLSNTTVTGNSATSDTSGSGGGIAIVNSSATAGKLSILNGSIVSTNTATGGTNAVYGGGVYYSMGPLVMDSSALRGNKAIDTNSSEYASGGGLYVQYASYSITNSEISGNNAQSAHVSWGGGIDSIYSSANSAIVNTTISGNTVTVNGTCCDAYGGGISIGPNGVTVTLANVTISGNSADSPYTDGGGLSNALATSGIVMVQNTMIAGNTDTTATTPDRYGYQITSGGYNIIGNNTGCAPFISTTGDQVGTGSNPIDPRLGTLANNGGKTQTMALLAGSPAVDAGNPAGCKDASGATLITDQRGDSRPADGNGNGSIVCDIGAYERGTEHAPSASAGSLSTTAGTAATGTLTASDADGDSLTFAIASQPTHGTLKLTDASKGTFTYTPASGYSGSDNFSFTATDGYLDSNAGTESITVKAVSSGSGGGGGGGFGIITLFGFLLGLLVNRRNIASSRK